jgi:hypothetical protein
LKLLITFSEEGRILTMVDPSTLSGAIASMEYRPTAEDLYATVDLDDIEGRCDLRELPSRFEVAREGGLVRLQPRR